LYTEKFGIQQFASDDIRIPKYSSETYKCNLSSDIWKRERPNSTNESGTELQNIVHYDCCPENETAPRNRVASNLNKLNSDSELQNMSNVTVMLNPRKEDVVCYQKAFVDEVTTVYVDVKTDEKVKASTISDREKCANFVKKTDGDNFRTLPDDHSNTFRSQHVSVSPTDIATEIGNSGRAACKNYGMDCSATVDQYLSTVAVDVNNQLANTATLEEKQSGHSKNFPQKRNNFTNTAVFECKSVGSSDALPTRVEIFTNTPIFYNVSSGESNAIPIQCEIYTNTATLEHRGSRMSEAMPVSCTNTFVSIQESMGTATEAPKEKDTFRNIAMFQQNNLEACGEVSGQIEIFTNHSLFQRTNSGACEIGLSVWDNVSNRYVKDVSVDKNISNSEDLLYNQNVRYDNASTIADISPSNKFDINLLSSLNSISTDGRKQHVYSARELNQGHESGRNQGVYSTSVGEHAKQQSNDTIMEHCRLKAAAAQVAPDTLTRGTMTQMSQSFEQMIEEFDKSRRDVSHDTNLLVERLIFPTKCDIVPGLDSDSGNVIISDDASSVLSKPPLNAKGSKCCQCNLAMRSPSLVNVGTNTTSVQSNDRGSSPRRISVVHRSASPCRPLHCTVSTSIRPYQNTVGTNTRSFTLVDTGYGDSSVKYTDSSVTPEPTASMIEKKSNTPCTLFMHRSTSTDNQDTVSTGTSTVVDVTAIYRQLVNGGGPPRVTVSRGTCTSGVMAVTAECSTSTTELPLDPVPLEQALAVDRASSPIRIICLDKAVTANKVDRSTTNSHPSSL